LLGSVAARAALVLGSYRPPSVDTRLLRRRLLSVDRRRVLVTDGEQRASLAVVRSLGRAGYDVYETSKQGKSLAGASRYSLVVTPVPEALSAPDAFAVDVQRLMTAWSIDLLLPVTEASLLALLA